jgi:hypothetical protein
MEGMNYRSPDKTIVKQTFNNNELEQLFQNDARLEKTSSIQSRTSY